MNQWLKNIQYRLLPPVCLLCGAAGQEGIDLCAACEGELPRNPACCARCAEPLSGLDQREALCGHCLVDPPAYERCLAPFQYAYPVDHLLQRLKFNARLEVAALLGGLMAQWLAETVEQLPACLVPVPLHSGRLRERGFNQALELARPVARRLKVPLLRRQARRILPTASQLGLSRQARRDNVKACFKVDPPVSSHVALIDDVMTTGSTARELAQCYLQAGAKRVEVWVCARA